MRRSPGPPAVLAALVIACASALVSCDRTEAARGENAEVTPGPEWSRPGGRWHPTERLALTVEQSEEIARLRSLGYVSGSQAPPEETGVTVHRPGRAWDGLNFYTSGHFPGATLMDMDGNILHEWRHSFIDAWRAGPRGKLPGSTKGAGFWRRAHLFENGDVLAVFDGMGLIKVDRESQLIWSYLEGAHHDVDVLPDGRVLVLVREACVDPAVNPDHAVLEDYVAVLDSDGKELRRVGLLDAFRSPRFEHFLSGMKTSGDLFHTNTIEVLDGSLAGRVAGFEAGNVLVCVRELDTIAVVDLTTEQVVWAARAPWSRPHQPTVLPNGNLMIFDNRGYGGFSRVVEFDPATLDIVWDYHGEDPQDFYSRECGSNQRLPNGNTLITESDGGRAFEVAGDMTVAWEYVNPAHAGESNEFIASIFDMVRLRPDFPLDWLSGG
jgi:hypothetical protein